VDCSPPWRELWNRLRNIALAFHCEAKVDFAPWPELTEAQYVDQQTVGYLLTNGEGRALGGAAVGWKDSSDHPGGWWLHWVWIAPPYRRCGLMRRLWTELAAQYPGLLPEPPYTASSASFVLSLPNLPEELHSRAQWAARELGTSKIA
jgi:hypothetical protein